MKRLTETLIKLFPFTEKYVNDIKLRTELFLKFGLMVNVGFATYNLFTGVLYRSIWFGAVSVYYIMLCLIKFFLIVRGFNRGSDAKKEHRDFLICGIMLLVLNLTITALIYQMIWQNKSHFYSETVIYAAATYTIFRVSAAIFDTLNLRKLNSPTLYASKALSISVALMAFFSLQTSVLDRLGMEESLRRELNIFTGSLVGITVIIVAIRTILRAHGYLKKQKRHY